MRTEVVYLYLYEGEYFDQVLEHWRIEIHTCEDKCLAIKPHVSEKIHLTLPEHFNPNSTVLRICPSDPRLTIFKEEINTLGRERVSVPCQLMS